MRETRIAFRILVDKPEGNRPVGVGITVNALSGEPLSAQEEVRGVCRKLYNGHVKDEVGRTCSTNGGD